MTKLPLSKKIFYGLGQLGVTIPAFFISTYLFAFYSPTTGKMILEPFYVGVAYLLGTLIQAVANPFIGHWSDNLITRFGRRRPFILVGTIPLALAFIFIWFPPQNQLIAFLSLIVIFSLFNFFFAFVVLPYLALIPEISISFKDRIRLTTISSYFSILGIILSSAIPAVMLSENYTISFISIIFGVIVLLAFIIVFFTIRERNFALKRPKTFSFTKAIVETFKNKTFDIYIFAYLAFQFGFYLFLSSIYYWIAVLVLPESPNPAQYVGIFELVAVIFAVIFSPILVKYSEKHGKKRSFILFTLLFGLAAMLLSVVGLIPLHNNFYLALALTAFAGFGLTAYFILPNAIISDIIDEDETRTGFRREGMYFGVQGFLERIPSALSGLALGAWLSFLYFPTHDPIFIRLLEILCGITFVITAILFIFVPLKEGLIEK